MSAVLPSVFCMITKVQPTGSIKRNFRSIVLQPPRALYLQQQSRLQMFGNQLLCHHQESPQRLIRHFYPTSRSQTSHLSNGRGRADGGLKMTKSSCSFPLSLFHRRLMFQTLTHPVSQVHELALCIYIYYFWNYILISYFCHTAICSSTSFMNMCVFDVLAQDLRGLGYKKGKPLGLVGVTELSEDQKRQIKEQQEVGKYQWIVF